MFKNKKILLLLIAFIIILPFFPIHAANTWDDAISGNYSLVSFGADVFNGVISGISVLVSRTLQQFCLFILNLSSGILSWVTSSDFIGMGAADITKGSPTYNFIVDMGWGIVRNLANAALVIGLVYIAINIILGNEEGKIKKTLINFILIALLINFTPVICGFIIDGSNIIMNSFLTGGTGGDYAKAISDAFDIASADPKTSDNSVNLLVANLAICAFGLIASIIYILYAAIFALRHIFLWILVIVSPIAFATKVFPKSEYITKVFPSITYWNEWWSQFIQWCVIGIPAGFFIYLANALMRDIAMNGGTMVSTSSASGVSACLQGLLPYLVPLGFLLVGFFMTISAGQQAASGTAGAATAGLIAGIGASALSRIGGITKTKEGWEVKGGLAGMASKAPAGVLGGALGLYEGAAKEGQGVTGRAAGAATGALGGAFTAGGRERIVSGYHKRIMEKVGLEKKGSYEASIAGDVSKAQKEVENLSDNSLHEIAEGKDAIPTLLSKLTKKGATEKAGVFNELAKRKKISKPELDYLAKNVDSAKSFNINLKDIAKGNPDFAPQFIGEQPHEVISGLTAKKAGETIYSSAYSRSDALIPITNNGPEIIDGQGNLRKDANIIAGKLSKGNTKDLDNIRTGYAEMLSKIPAFNGKTIDTKELGKFTNDPANYKEIVDHIATLAGGTVQDQERGRAIERLTNVATKRIL